jgi:hypothetical protein
VFFDDLVDDPMRVTTEICAWLSIDDIVTRDFDYEAENRSVFYRASALQRIALSVNRSAELFFNRHRGLKRVLKRVYYAVNAHTGRQPRPAADAHERLAAIYASSNQRLAEQLRRHGYRSLPSWLQPAGAVTEPHPGTRSER